jgi:hypothetical protein
VLFYHKLWNVYEQGVKHRLGAGRIKHWMRKQASNFKNTDTRHAEIAPIFHYESLCHEGREEPVFGDLGIFADERHSPERTLELIQCDIIRKHAGLTEQELQLFNLIVSMPAHTPANKLAHLMGFKVTAKGRTPAIYRQICGNLRNKLWGKFIEPTQRTKKCLKCSTVKPVADFHRKKGRRDGYQDWCQICMKGVRKNGRVLQNNE